MSKIKDKFLQRYLPLWAKETVFAENRRLQRKNSRLEAENNSLKAKINGMETVLKVLGVNSMEVVQCEDCERHAGCIIEDLMYAEDPEADKFCSFGERREEECTLISH